MRAFLFLSLVATVFAVCPSRDPLDFSMDRTLVGGYRYNFEVPKEASNAAGRFTIALPADKAGKFLLLKFDSEITPNDAVSWIYKESSSGFPDAAVPATDLDCGTIGNNQGDCKRWIDLSTTGAATMIYFTIDPSCSICRETSEFAIESFFTNSNGENYDYDIHALKEQIRTGTFQTKSNNVDNYVDFAYTAPAAGALYLSIAVDVSDSTSTTRFYYVNNATNPARDDFKDDSYPSLNAETGSYAMAAPFDVSSAGVKHISVRTVTSGSSNTLFTDWSIKAGWNEAPCAAGFSNSASLFVFALAPLAFLLNKML